MTAHSAARRMILLDEYRQRHGRLPDVDEAVELLGTGEASVMGDLMAYVRGERGRWWTVAAWAEATGLTISAIQHRCAEGLLPAIKIYDHIGGVHRWAILEAPPAREAASWTDSNLARDIGSVVRALRTAEGKARVRLLARLGKIKAEAQRRVEAEGDSWGSRSGYVRCMICGMRAKASADGLCSPCRAGRIAMGERGGQAGLPTADRRTA